jgi:hypothetical protein
VWGCGGGSKTNTPQGPLLPFDAGLYDITAFTSSNSNSAFELAGSLMQNGASISGVLHFTSSACFPFTTDIPTVGTITDTSVDLVSSFPSGQKLVFTNLIHPVGHPQFLNGAYSVSGPGCFPADPGSISLNAQGVTAHWTGNLTSTQLAKGGIGMSLTQTGPDVHGLFSATGTATFTAGDTCFANATVDPATLILGKGSTVVLDDSATGTTGKTVLTGDFFPASPVGAGFFNGTYTSTEGACSESGSISMSMF